MIKSKAVFVLGAGASIPYGYPSGPGPRPRFSISVSGDRINPETIQRPRSYVRTGTLLLNIWRDIPKNFRAMPGTPRNRNGESVDSLQLVHCPNARHTLAGNSSYTRRQLRAT